MSSGGEEPNDERAGDDDYDSEHGDASESLVTEHSREALLRQQTEDQVQRLTINCDEESSLDTESGEIALSDDDVVGDYEMENKENDAQEETVLDTEIEDTQEDELVEEIVEERHETTELETPPPQMKSPIVSDAEIENSEKLDLVEANECLDDPNGLPQEANGHVKWYDTEKAFGFLTCEQTQRDVFFHKSNVEVMNIHPYPSVAADQTVKFDTIKTPKGLEAINVVVTGDTSKLIVNRRIGGSGRSFGGRRESTDGFHANERHRGNNWQYGRERNTNRQPTDRDSFGGGGRFQNRNAFGSSFNGRQERQYGGFRSENGGSFGYGWRLDNSNYTNAPQRGWGERKRGGFDRHRETGGRHSDTNRNNRGMNWGGGFDKRRERDVQQHERSSYRQPTPAYNTERYEQRPKKQGRTAWSRNRLVGSDMEAAIEPEDYPAPGGHYGHR